MKFEQAMEFMKKGAKVKLPSWSGYWCIEDGSIKMHCKDGRIIDIRETEDVLYTLGNIISNEWEIADYHNSPAYNGEYVLTFGFGDALRHLKNGRKVMREGWNGKGMFVVYQKGYPNGIPCNAQTANAWGMNEGDLFRCEPYLQIKMVNGSHAMWVPSINDVLATDWVLAE
jgi:hypothetical protein